MADDLRAKFQLDFAVGSSEPLTAIQEILERIDQSLEKLRQATNPFAELTEPVARATQATKQLNEAVTRTTTATEAAAEGVSALGGALNEIGEGAAQATTGLGRMGTEAEETASRVSTAMERAQAAYRAAAEMAQLPAASPSPNHVGRSITGYMSQVGSGTKAFHEAVNDGMGKAFGAAATGFGVIMPVRAAAEYDNALTHIGITLGVPTAQNPKFSHDLGRKIDAIARANGQKSTDLVDSASFLSMEGFKLPQIMSFTPTVARISTAYNAAPHAVAQTAFTLNHSMHISDKDMPTGLAMVARVGKESDLPMESLATLFPEALSQGAFLGVSGLQGVRDMAAMTALIRKSVGRRSEAVTNLKAMMQTLTTQHGRQRFSKELGVNIEKVMNNAVSGGIDPIEAVLEKIRRTGDATKQKHYIAALFGNEQDQAAVAAILKNLPEYFSIRARIGNTSPKMIDEDFAAGLQSTKIRVNSFDDALQQLLRRIGTAFVPVVNVATKALYGLSDLFDWLDDNMKGAATVMVTSVGGVLALTAGLGALGAVMIPLKAGFALLNAATGGMLGRFTAWGLRLAKLPFARVGRLLIWAARGALLFATELTPVGWAITAVAAAATAGYFAWKNWDKIKPMLSSLGNWIAGWAKQIGGYLTAMLHPLDKWFDHTSMGQAMDKWLVHPDVPAAVSSGSSGTDTHAGKFGLHVSHDPGLNVRQTSGRPGLVHIAPDRGRMVAQP